MTPEQLLQPRYEVIADYPNSPFKVGDVLSALNITGSLFANQQQKAFIDFYDNEYPYLFRRMHWSERRNLSDMPEYIKYKSISTGEVRVFKSDNWHYGKHPRYYGQDNVLLFKRDNKLVGFKTYYLPATEQEYTNYQNYLNQTK